MNDSRTPILIGVDGGGTSCRVALLMDGRRTEVRTGRANVSTDPEGSVATIRAGIDEVAVAAGLPPEALPACHAYLGLAGVMGPDEARFVADRLPFDRVRVEDDRPSAVAGALGPGFGTVAGIGTGSFLARQSAEGLALLGGWGLVLGDEASGAWLGRHLLARLLHTVDGLAPATPFSDALLAEFGGSAGVVRYSLRAAPRDFGGLAPRIIEAAAGGDATARDLMAGGADYIARSARALGWRPGETFCLIGGLAPHYAPYLPEPMAAALRAPEGNALDGTLLLAGRIAAEAP